MLSKLFYHAIKEGKAAHQLEIKLGLNLDLTRTSFGLYSDKSE